MVRVSSILPRDYGIGLLFSSLDEMQLRQDKLELRIEKLENKTKKVKNETKE